MDRVFSTAMMAHCGWQANAMMDFKSKLQRAQVVKLCALRVSDCRQMSKTANCQGPIAEPRPQVVTVNACRTLALYLK